jgi:lambda repressor-like predicted transcriptional regulator
MKQRCTNKNDPGYKNYGGRGISVCHEWLNSFERFFADMGHPPKGKTIERMNNNGSYEPSNCRWATHTEQCQNQRRTRLNIIAVRAIRFLYKKGVSIKRISQAYGINESTIAHAAMGRTWVDAEAIVEAGDDT